jgi:acetoacetyl-CoA synthetase
MTAVEMNGTPSAPGDLLWAPSEERKQSSRIADYLSWLARERGVVLDGYAALWRYSVDRLEDFWGGLWDYFELGPRGSDIVLERRVMPGARWFPSATLNYAARLATWPRMQPAVVQRSEDGARRELSYGELGERVGRCRAGLQRLGVERGDRVVGYLPNGIEALVAFFATASLGAVWSSCPPEFGVESVLDRFSQIEPKVLIACRGYRYNGKYFDRGGEVALLQQRLVSLQATVHVGEAMGPLFSGPSSGASPAPSSGPSPAVTVAAPSRVESSFDELCSVAAPLAFEAVPFEHPLWILFSSGTTGLPKPIVHGHGGMLLEHLKVLALHSDLGPKDRFFWFSTTGWMMWNYLMGGLLVGATVVLYDGNPGYPDLNALWRMASEERVTYFGCSAPFLMACRAAGLTPGQSLDLSTLRSIGSTGAPLPSSGFDWVYRAVSDDVLLGSVSGGTDLCTAFVVSCPLLPVYSAELQCLGLGAKVEAFDANAKPVIGQVGELVITAPMPCMPVSFWNDPEGKRYRESYFDHYPGVWRHGDWIQITERGSAIITGRSDSTLNRGGVRMGTSEFYRVVEDLPQIKDSVVVDTSDAEGKGTLWLFVVAAPGYVLDAALVSELKRSLRSKLSPRHVPDEIVAITEVPRTLSGKKLEVPIKRLLGGAPLEQVVNPGTLQRPQALFELLAAVQSHTLAH